MVLLLLNRLNFMFVFFYLLVYFFLLVILMVVYGFVLKISWLKFDMMKWVVIRIGIFRYIGLIVIFFWLLEFFLFMFL